MSDIGVASGGLLGVFMGTLSYVLIWVFIFGAAIVAMVVLHIYLPLKKRESYRIYAAELSCFGGLWLFLLLQLALAGGIQPLPTLVFLLLLIPIGIKVLLSSVRDALGGGADNDGMDRAVTIISAPSLIEENDDQHGDAGDVVLVRLSKDRVRGFSAIRVTPIPSATTFGESHGCVTLLTTLSKFQGAGSGLEWVFKVDVDPSSGASSYVFIITASGKTKRRGSGTIGAEQNCTVNLVRKATVYLRSALQSAGFTSRDEAPVPGVELVESLSIAEENVDDGGGCGTIVTIRGLPEKTVTVEDLESSSGQKLRWMRDSSYSSSASLFHPVGRLVRFMMAGNIDGSYVVRFKKAKPPEGIAIMDKGMIEATSNAGTYGVRGGGVAGSSLSALRNSVAGRLRLEAREELAEEAMAGVRRGYWNVESNVVLPGRSDDDMAVKVSSTIVSCFSGGMRSVETSTIPIQTPLSKSSLIEAWYPFVSDPRFHFFTGDMSSDSLATFITLSPPYPAPSCESTLAEFESPQNGDGGGNGYLHLGRAYFRGTLVGEVKITIGALPMHMVVLGETGFGKTSFVVDLVNQLWDLDPTLDWTIIDLKGEYLNQLKNRIDEPITVLKPGRATSGEGDGRVVFSPLRIDLFELANVGGLEDPAERIFSILKESLAGLFRENVEFSPMMERILRESLRRVYSDMKRGCHASTKGSMRDGREGFFDVLLKKVERYVDIYGKGKVDIDRSGEALENRIDRFRRGVLGDVFNAADDAGRGDGGTEESRNRGVGSPSLCSGKVIIDLSECIRRGCGREDMRLLLNIVMEVIFESAFRRGLVGAPEARHLTIVEEANLLVPDVLHRRTMGDLTGVEDMILTARGFGEGLILVAQRPTVSSFVLANAGTKVVFRSPYDSRRVGEFMGLNESQEEAVKSLGKFEAIVTTVHGGPYRVSTAKPLSLETKAESHRQRR